MRVNTMSPTCSDFASSATGSAASAGADVSSAPRAPEWASAEVPAARPVQARATAPTWRSGKRERFMGEGRVAGRRGDRGAWRGVARLETTAGEVPRRTPAGIGLRYPVGQSACAATTGGGGDRGDSALRL